jgi:hypothetical protein
LFVSFIVLLQMELGIQMHNTMQLHFVAEVRDLGPASRRPATAQAEFDRMMQKQTVEGITPLKEDSVYSILETTAASRGRIPSHE